jgi:hypothetical protein
MTEQRMRRGYRNLGCSLTPFTFVAFGAPLNLPHQD